jgi:hypothetical protein
MRRRPCLLLLLLVLFLPPRCDSTVVASVLILGVDDVASSLIPDTIFPLLVGLTNATTVDPGHADVDALLGKTAKVLFPNGSFYSFALVYVTRIRFTLHTPNDEAAAAMLRCCLSRPLPPDRAIACEDVAVEQPLAFFLTPWPSYVGFSVVAVWVLTVAGFVSFLLCNRQPKKTALGGSMFTATRINVQLAAPRSSRDPRGISGRPPARGGASSAFVLAR